MAKALRRGGRVLVIRLGALGDTILCLPAVRALRRAVGARGRVDWIGYPRYLQLAVNAVHASAAFDGERALFAGLFTGDPEGELVQFLKQYDWVVAWCRDGGGHLARLLARLEIPCVQLPPSPPAGEEVHASEHLLESLEPLGIEADDSNPEIVVSEEAWNAGDGLLRELGVQSQRFLAIHPGSGDRRKNWSPAKFSQISKRAAEAGIDVVLLEGEADAGPVRELLADLELRPPVIRGRELQTVARLLSVAALYLGNDSGISHLAAAVGVPTIALFGPTDPRVWAPRGRWVRILPLRATGEEVWSVIQTCLPAGRRRTSSNP